MLTPGARGWCSFSSVFYTTNNPTSVKISVFFNKNYEMKKIPSLYGLWVRILHENQVSWETRYVIPSDPSRSRIPWPCHGVPPQVEGLLVDGALTEGQAAIKKQKYLYERWRMNHFYSCVLSCLAFEWNWGWCWSCFDRNLPAFLTLMMLLSYQQLVGICIGKAVRFLSQNGQLQPRFHSKARQLSQQL